MPPLTVLVTAYAALNERQSNQMEPTRQVFSAFLSLRRAAHLARWADGVSSPTQA